ncbi:MAG: LTA synthase family protein [Bacilli bacterium]|nr:LTA synthase family protein [Bacilli bacterium]MDD4733661.1 LTA synthase family protein [Bacilli bacterium]
MIQLIKKVINKISEFTEKSSLFTGLLIFVLSGTIMLGTFCFTNPNINLKYIASYFLSPTLLFLNLLPIILLLYLLYILCNRLWVSYFLTTFIFIIASLINKYKIIFRDFPFIFEDIGLFFEATKMTETYKITLDIFVILILIIYILMTVLLLFIKTKKIVFKFKIPIIFVIILVGIVSYRALYTNEKLYNKLGYESIINKMSQTQKFQIRGFVYAFINSSKVYVYPKPEGYNESEVTDTLKLYSNKNIEEDKKINIIAIMLEAYNDFSKYKNIEFEKDIYEDFHKIVSQSYHGTLISNVFAGGTIDTERAFLTGNFLHNQYLKPTNSFIWYLRNQGYYTEAMHPIFGWFYNRRNVNINLGFDNYDYFENKYKSQDKEFLMDNDFIKEIIKGFENNSKRKNPYFNFSVTYQNHGPYEKQNTGIIDNGINYIKNKEKYDESTYKIVNNYFMGIDKTNQAITELINYFESVEEPVAILLFGDHNPGFGVGNAGYKMLEIDLDLSTEEGFMNYYSVPYLIWGNQSAKKRLNKDFKGQGNTVSPNYLMPELFEYLGYEGNEYMQFITKMKKNVPVINNNISENFSIFKDNSLIDYKKIQYYYINNF